MYDAVYEKIRGRAEIAGVGEMDITQLHVEFPLNDIPFGWITLAVGTDVDTGKAVNTSSLAAQLSTQAKVKVYLKIGKDGEKCIFDGFTTGTSWIRSTQEMGYSVGMVGWMESLRSSSALTQSFSVVSPGDLFASATALVDTFPVWQAVVAGLKYRGQLASDTWNGCKAALKAICKTKFLTASGRAAIGGSGIAATDNTGAIEALDKFTGDNIAIQAYAASDIGERMAHTLGAIGWGGQGGDTIWSMMLALAGAFGFAIIPKVSSARCVAFTPMLKSSAITKSITADTYQWVRGGTLSAKRARGVVLLGKLDVSPTYPDKKLKETKYMAGRYDSGLAGQWTLLSTPAWLGGLTPLTKKTPETTGVGFIGGVRANGDAAAPGAPPDNSAAEVYNAFRSDKLGDNFAHDQWLKLVLRGRSASLVGKVRYDIGPGSNVKIETARSITGSRVMYASVNKVSIDVDVAKSHAGTTFEIDSMRTAEEDKLCVAKHPMYDTVFAGDSLI